MFLNFISLVKCPIVSSASRNKTLFVNAFPLQKKISRLSLRLKSNAGRNSKGRIVFWTRTSLIKRYKTIKINYKISYNYLNFIASFQFISFSNKLVSLIYLANGSITYHVTTDVHNLFDFSYLNCKKNLRNYFTESYWSPLYLLKKLTFVNFIELVPSKRAQYCLSAGTRSKITELDKKTRTAWIELPSSVKKMISYYSCVFTGRVALEEKKKYKNTRSGYWRSFGKKSIVRGVAMNAVDHPHGGRTKSLRYPQTPWGKTTKFK